MKENNKGFSLVELLVAITVLVIVAVPLLHSFVSAARTNAKARKKMEATTVAENVMEQIKGTSLSDLLNTSSAGGTVRTEKNSDGTYYAYFDSQSVNGQTFNARALFDADAYKTGTAPEETAYNDTAVTDLSTMDVLKDGFYVQDSEQDRMYAQKLANDIGGNTTADLVLKNLTRSATISISSSRSGNDNVTTAMITYVYSYLGKSETMQAKIYDNSDIDNGTLKDIYLFYSPLYSSVSSADLKDQIVIINDSEVPVTVYLVKQSTTADTNDVNQQNYKVGVTVSEKASAASSGWQSDESFAAACTIRTNIGWSVTKGTDGKYKEIATQPVLTYKHNGSTLQDDRAKAVLGYTNLQGEQAEDRIFKVTVQVYKSDDGSDKYSDSNLLLTYTGTKED